MPALFSSFPQRFFFGDARRIRGSDRARKGREPNAQLCWLVIDDVVHAWRPTQCRNSRCCGILDMYEGPNSAPTPRHGELLIASLIDYIAVLRVPGTETLSGWCVGVN
jgi:hypothetical protein